MATSPISDAFDDFLAELARTPDAPLCASQLPSALDTASLVDDRFRMERLVGSGGSAEVFLATDIVLGRPVAVKIARDGLSGSAQRRWLREAEALARLEHPNVVQVFRVGSHRGRSFIVMAWIEGQTLAAWSRASPRPWPELLARYREAGEGLAAAHAAGLVHRDFKPQNVLIGADGRVRVADFGLAALAAEPTLSEDTPGDAGPRWNVRITRGALGTLGYMPPEQFDGGRADPRSDQFSFCAALFEGLVGRVPYEATTLEAARDRAAAGEFDVPKDANVPRWLMAALCRGLRPEPSDRFEDMRALLDALDPERYRSSTMLSLGVLALGSLVGLGVWFADPGAAPCATTLEDTWTPRRADALRQAFERTQAPDASRQSSHAVATLDAWAEQWTSRRADACAAPPSKARDTRLTCLERSRTTAQGVLDVLVAADVAVVASAPEILRQLEHPSRCEGSDLADALPLDPERILAVEEARRMLARSNADRVAGRLNDAHATAGRALEIAQSVAYDPVIAEALLARGRAEAALDLPGGCLEDLEAAYWKANALRHDALAAAAARAVLANVAIDPRAWDRAERWSRLAEAAEHRLSSDASVSWELLRARGAAAYLAQRYDEARQLFSDALEAMPDDRVADRAALLARLSVLEFDHGRLQESLEHAEASLALAEAELPAEHIARARGLERRARALSHLGRAEEAVAPMREAIALKRRLFGDENPRAIVSLNSLGSVLRTAGDLEEALEVHRRALEVSLARPTPDPFELGSCWAFIGQTLVDLDRHEEARDALKRSIDAYEEAGGPGALNRGLMLISLATAYAKLEDLDRALTSIDAALELLLELTPESSQVAGALANRAMMHMMQSRPQAALDDLAKARPIAEKLQHPPLLEMIEGLQTQARDELEQK